MKTQLQSLLTYCNIPDAKAFRIISSSDRTVAVGADLEKHRWIFRAEATTPVAEWDGGDFTIPNPSFLRSLTEYAAFKNSPNWEVIRDTRGGKVCPVAFCFTDEEGRPAVFRLGKADLMNMSDHVRKINYDVEFSPLMEKINELSKLSGIFSSFHTNYTIKVKNGDLCFYLGDDDAAASSTHGTYVKMASGFSDTFRAGGQWEIASVLQIFKFLSGSDITSTQISLSREVMRVGVTTADWTYHYFIPALKI